MSGRGAFFHSQTTLERFPNMCKLQTGLLFLNIVLNASCPNPNPLSEYVTRSHKGLGLGLEALKR